MARNPLALSAAGVSLATLAFQVFKDHIGFDFPPVPTEALLCDCPEWPISFPRVRFDWISLGLGICIGLFLGPIIDSIVLLRHLLGGYLRRQVLSLFRPANLYRVV